MKKSKITFDNKMSWWKGDTFIDDTISLAIKKAYRDLMRTIRGFAQNPKHDIIIKNANNTLHNSISQILELENLSQEKFDKEHKKACDKLIASFENQEFTYGQAQKWINMTFKYLNLLDYKPVEKVYEYCHIPIDSYMLTATNYYINTAWSKIKDYDLYMEYQIWFRNSFPNEIPLDKEFFIWLEEARKH